jgi:hypothetical protein
VIDRYEVNSDTCSFPIPSGNFYVTLNFENNLPYILFFSSSNYLQNMTIHAYSHHYYKDTPLNIGYDVTNNNSNGNVILKSGSKVTINNGTGGVTIKNGFECEKGAELTIE